ncbi:MAG: CRISPR-associated protein Cas5 [Clostridia bacterium]|nr:CRISPR-associated protein Cas5 [Clostridia bacterium]MDW7726945.1 CRISPR-associated protein Cas5 [Candidatus Methanoperedens sp.]
MFIKKGEVVDAIRLHVRGVFNSYRDPKTHKIHRTFPFPPRTTLIGLAGAALGLSEDVLWDEYKDLQVAVIAISKENSLGGEGRADDLIKYKKFKDNDVETSILIRELLYKPEYLIYYTSSEKNVLGEIHEAFLNPKYALSLGHDDELIILHEIEKVNLIPLESGEYGETILPFNPSAEGFHIDITKQRYFEPCTLVTLPTQFIIKNGIRTPSKLQTYAFLKNLRIHITKNGGFTDGAYNFFFL